MKKIFSKQKNDADSILIIKDPNTNKTILSLQKFDATEINAEIKLRTEDLVARANDGLLDSSNTEFIVDGYISLLNKLRAKLDSHEMQCQLILDEHFYLLTNTANAHLSALKYGEELLKNASTR